MIKDAVIYLASIALAFIVGGPFGEVATFMLAALVTGIGFAAIVLRNMLHHVI